MLLCKSSIRRHADRAAQQAAGQTAFVTDEILQRLMSRLDYMKLAPTRILDLGAQFGASSELLRRRYPKAQVISADLSVNRLARYRRRWYQRCPTRVCLDYEALPFAQQSFDLVFANLAFNWVNDLPLAWQECFRVLRPQGLLLFTMPGPDTLKELRASAQNMPHSPHTHQFVDMHDIGDMLVKTRFVDPVMDMEYLQLRYPRVTTLLQDLKALGAVNARTDRCRGLLPRGYWRQLEEQYQQQWQMMDGSLPVTLELVYGQAWMPTAPLLGTLNAQGEVHVPIEILTRKAKK